MNSFSNEDYELESRRHQYRMSGGYRAPFERPPKKEESRLVAEENEDGLVHAHHPEKLREEER